MITALLLTVALVAQTKPAEQPEAVKAFFAASEALRPDAIRNYIAAGEANAKDISLAQAGKITDAGGNKKVRVDKNWVYEFDSSESKRRVVGELMQKAKDIRATTELLKKKKAWPMPPIKLEVGSVGTGWSTFKVDKVIDPTTAIVSRTYANGDKQAYLASGWDTSKLIDGNSWNVGQGDLVVVSTTKHDGKTIMCLQKGSAEILAVYLKPGESVVSKSPKP